MRYTGFNIELEISQVLRYMGMADHKDKNQVEQLAEYNPGLLKKIIELCDQGKNKLHPQVTYRYIKTQELCHIMKELGPCEASEILNKDLKPYDQVIIVLITLGKQIEDWNALLQINGALSQLIIEAIGICALMEASTLLQLHIETELRTSDKVLSARWAPGDGGWPLAIQSVIFACFKKESLEVFLNSHFVMEPIQSMTFVYGFHKAICGNDSLIPCDTCGNTSCTFR